MRGDKAEFELLLTTARILRAVLRYSAGAPVDYREDVKLLDDALKPFDPLPGHSGDGSKEADAGARGLAKMIKDYGFNHPLVQVKLQELTS